MTRATLLVLVGGCTTLGPNPMTTGVAAVPAGRPAVEAQVGAVPAFHLSSAVSDPRGSAVAAASLVIEPDRFINAPGLLVGGRIFGESGDAYVEPIVGYRQQFGDLAVAGVVYGSSKRAENNLATYHGFRAGAELAADGRIGNLTRWLSLHTQVAASLTRIVASGRYCVNPSTGAGQDCSEAAEAVNTFVTGRIRGFYPAANVTLALDVGRVGWRGFSHARLGILLGTGFMPTADEFGEQGAAKAIFNGGLSLTLGFGAK